MPEPMTFSDAAYKLLKESGEPRHYRWIAEEALRQGLIKSHGKTPESTMYVAIADEIHNEVPGIRPSRFIKTGRGMFGLAEWQAETRPNQSKKSETEQRYFVFIVNDAQGVSQRLPARKIYDQLMKIQAWGIGERTPYRKDLRKGSRRR